jgi:hypothetical protein
VTPSICRRPNLKEGQSPVTTPDMQMPSDPDPKAAQRIARERIDELAAQISTAELVHHQEAIDVLEALEGCDSDGISDDLLVLAARHYLRLRKESDGEDPDPKQVLRDIREILGK